MSEHNGGETIPSMVLRHEKDLYRGNGKPGLCTRIQTEEDRMDATEKRIDGIDKKFGAIIVLLLTILGGVMTSMIRGAH